MDMRDYEGAGLGPFDSSDLSPWDEGTDKLRRVGAQLFILDTIQLRITKLAVSLNEDAGTLRK